MSEKPNKQLLQAFLDRLQTSVCGVLNKWLPAICAGNDDWWGVMVRGASLPNWQGKQVRSGRIKTLEELDIVSLVMLLHYQWVNLVQAMEITDPQKEGRLLCNAMKGLRDSLDHLGEGDLPDDETHAALTNLKKLLALLNADSDLLADVEAEWRRFGARLFGGDSTPGHHAGGSADVQDGGGARRAPAPASEMIPGEGIPLDILCLGEASQAKVQELLKEQNFIGIDFGTSTTVVSRMTLDEASGRIVTEPIPIPQPDRLGRTIEDHLVPSCIAWFENRLLVGQGAADLKPSLTSGKNLWFSFKMQLGIDLGPKYYNSQLQGPDKPVEILRDQDAARVFFTYLKQKVEEWLAGKGLPGKTRYAVSVPASFESNQRADLCRILEESGIEVAAHGICDEPNVAFISHVIESLRLGPAVLDAYQDKPKDVLVFDFGAGTCDISILRVEVKDKRLISQNLSISQFRALGGDNIDRRIARQILWPAMRKACAPDRDFLSAEIEKLILPRLQGSAEQLKIQCCKTIWTRWNGSDSGPLRGNEDRLEGEAVPGFKIDGVTLELPKPSISLAEFFRIMDPFLGRESDADEEDDEDPDVVSIFEPIGSALEKAGVGHDELDMVLFIGGSAQNPLVYEAISNHFGRFVECVIGEDIRTPVSRGAAVHAFAVYGLKVQLIRAITSEPIYVITAGNNLTQILPAGTPMPSEEIAFSDGLEVQADGQRMVQLPICVSNRNKTLGMLEIRPSDDRPLRKGETITLVCRVDENKLVQVTAKTGNSLATTVLMNPLANLELTADEVRRLMARQSLNESIVAGGGKPDPSTLQNYAAACSNADQWLEAAETRDALERVSPSHQTCANATSIAYEYSKAGKESLSARWAEKAYERRVTWVSAFNLALSCEGAGQPAKALELFEKAVELGPDQPVALGGCGQRLLSGGETERGTEMLKSALNLFLETQRTATLRPDDLARLRKVAQLLGRTDILEKVDEWERQDRRESLYSEKLLAASKRYDNAIDPH